MSDYLNETDTNSILSRLNAMQAEIDELKKRDLSVDSLDDISNDLGVITAGEFRAGNGVEPGNGFTGTRANADGFSGTNNDVLQALLSALDGSLTAGAGAARMDANGFGIYVPSSVITDSNPTVIYKIYNELLALVARIYDLQNNLYIEETGAGGGDSGVTIRAKSSSGHASGVVLSANKINNSQPPAVFSIELDSSGYRVAQISTDEFHWRGINGSDIALSPIQVKYITTAVSVVSNTTLADLVDFTFDVVAGGKYAFFIRLRTGANASGGLKFAINGDCTVTSIWYNAIFYGTDASIVRSNTLATALGTARGNTAGNSYVEISGFVNVNGQGTLTLQFAQNNSNANASTVYAGSSFELVKVG